MEEAPAPVLPPLPGLFVVGSPGALDPGRGTPCRQAQGLLRWVQLRGTLGRAGWPDLHPGPRRVGLRPGGGAVAAARWAPPGAGEPGLPGHPGGPLSPFSPAVAAPRPPLPHVEQYEVVWPRRLPAPRAPRALPSHLVGLPRMLAWGLCPRSSEPVVPLSSQPQPAVRRLCPSAGAPSTPRPPLPASCLTLPSGGGGPSFTLWLD